MNVNTEKLVMQKESERMAVLKIDRIVNSSYLQTLSSGTLIPYETKAADKSIEDTACFFPIRQFTYDKEEDSFSKLASVYTGAAAAYANPVLVIRGYASGMTELYLGVCGEENRINGAFPKVQILRDNLIGQFPGIRSAGSGILPNDATRRMVNSCFDPNYRAIAAVSCVASAEESKDGSAFDSRGLEKLIESMNGREYTMIVLAKNVPAPGLKAMRSELEDLYCQLSSLGKISITTGRQDGVTLSRTVTDSVSRGVNKSQSVTLSAGTSEFASISANWGRSSSQGMSINLFDGIVGMNTNEGVSIGAGVSSGQSKQKNQAKGTQVGTVDTVGTANAVGDAKNTSANLSIQYSLENKRIQEVLKAIDRQLTRLRIGSSVGMFSVCAYCLAPSLADARVGACSYKALVTEKESDIENIGINTWVGDSYRKVLGYLKNFRHPVFEITKETDNWTSMNVTPATLVTARELAVHMPLLRKAVNGVAVRESVSFGRNVISMNADWPHKPKIRVGNVYHLDHEEKNEAFLLRDSLTMHTFVTGTTGSGKSNALYWILAELIEQNQDTRFMVIEPAKGEYKDIFADRDDVTVYGVNPYISPLLRIDPFSFAPGIHIQEHLDRLMGIFTVCWPMYAAMPAVLKKAIINAYEGAGWDMRTSRNRYRRRIFPTFKDVMQYVEFNVRASNYSADTKGDYIGSLCTRLEELTDGFSGMIFVPNAVADEDLFDRNTIVDISRIGSAETKSLIMGMLVMKLQEYRMAGKRSGHLRHVTVLEEAHHLLKHAENAGESSGIVGRSVEMLTNAIAEMRSSGEGFIIADQSPALMDRSVIRNTNTKIVLRLPESEDRETVGRSIGLTSTQIAELPKLPCGVAAVYQNDWLEAVLVKIPYYEPSSRHFVFTPKEEDILAECSDGGLLDALIKNKVQDWLRGKIDDLERLNLPSEVKWRLVRLASDSGELNNSLVASIAWAYFNTSAALAKAGDVVREDFESWSSRFAMALIPSVMDYSDFEVRRLLMQLLRSQAAKNPAVSPLYFNYCSWLKSKYLQ